MPGQGMTPTEITKALAKLDTITPALAAYLMVATGFPRDEIPMGLWVIEHESGFKKKAYNPVDCGSGYHAQGAFQICGPHNLKGCESCNSGDCYSWWANFRCAHAIWDQTCGGSFCDSQWPGYLSQRAQAEAKYGKYKDMEFANLGGAFDFKLPDPGGVFGSVAEAIGAIVSLIKYLFEPTFWLRMAKLIGGFLLLAYGVISLGKALLGIDLPKMAARGASAIATRGASEAALG